MHTHRSLILITVDCLRADHVGFLRNSATTPFLDSLAAQSLVFKNAIVAGTPTYYSFPAIMASRYPLALGRDVVGLAPGEPTLASVLKNAGYATGCFLAANPYLSRQFGYDQGFDDFCDHMDLPAASAAQPTVVKNGSQSSLPWNERCARLFRRLRMGAFYDDLYFQYLQRIVAPPVTSLDALRPFPTADRIVDQVRGWLASHTKSPFFLWLHLMDPHAPYFPVQAGLDLMKNKTSRFRARYLNAYWNRGEIALRKYKRYRDELVELYDACVRWVDAQIERLSAELRQLGLWETCVLALTADHGEEFLDHDGRYHAPTKLYEETTHVPLLLRIPGAQPRFENAPFSLLHFAPTLLDAVGVAAPNSFQGQSYFARLQNGENWDLPAITECVDGCKNPFQPSNRMNSRLLAVREREYKLVADFKEGSDRLFNLELDPKETKPLPAGKAGSVRRRLLEVAHEHLNSSWSKRDASIRVNAQLHELKRTLSNAKTAGAVANA